ncbi:acyl-CoA dehydrogenase family protein [Paraburkholderia saeva]|uniref:Acyl-CoA dehydrogenase FadE17 n=1 Tax=Paraburkholderia saeva TaxID=2777537 RepID=A0A9N8RSD6_9BURK|nr:acyl-CoA dehydrogenase family protein [Paraburkholderia saeva]CAG4886785.1 Putative acyl-CoA dehydrogenase FadE17 [Paraburkholderia saeva]CAG4887189.1 Putative acyl-CoA dehydrogenase FadE17 [Paraburkholderia saeva]
MFETRELTEFRSQAREFVRANLPSDIRDMVRSGRQIPRERTIAWYQILASHGYLVPHWPREWGGQGWTVQQELAFEEELCNNDAPEIIMVSFSMIAPILMRFGTPAQQQRFLPEIAAGRQWWCQGYSEPNAGSDLASVKTRAHRTNDGFVINGSKIWTSYAQYSDWIFCIVRTDADAKPQAGISFLLVDMKSPGVTVRPIVGIHGWVVFNEVFFDNVEVPFENLVGQENEGWTIAKSLLEFERLKLARIGENKRRRARAQEVGMTRTEGGVRLADRSWFRQRFAELEMQLMALEANAARFIQRAISGHPIGAEVSMLKLRGSRLIQLWEQLIVDGLGQEGLVLDPEVLEVGPPSQQQDPISATASSRRFVARGYTIAGGSSEIQRNILSKAVLGL